MTNHEPPVPKAQCLLADTVSNGGLLRHYSVIAKLLITVLATLLLLVHMQPVGHLADAAARATLAGGEREGIRIQLIADAAAALLVLLTAAALSVLKPRGVTRCGRRRRREQNLLPH